MFLVYLDLNPQGADRSQPLQALSTGNEGSSSSKSSVALDVVSVFQLKAGVEAAYRWRHSSSHTLLYCICTTLREKVYFNILYLCGAEYVYVNCLLVFLVCNSYLTILSFPSLLSSFLSPHSITILSPYLIFSYSSTIPTGRITMHQVLQQWGRSWTAQPLILKNGPYWLSWRGLVCVKKTRTGSMYGHSSMVRIVYIYNILLSLFIGLCCTVYQCMLPISYYVLN